MKRRKAINKQHSPKFRLPEKLDKKVQNLVASGMFVSKQSVVSFAVCKLLIEYGLVNINNPEVEL